MSAQRYKYPRTPHLSFSPGVREDDIQLNSNQIFANSQIVVTEKLDGENTTLLIINLISDINGNYYR